MATNLEKLQAFLERLNKEREAYETEAVPKIQELYQTDREKGRKPELVRDSSFLYIRSHAGDLGIRPFNEINFWNSPDLSLTATTGGNSSQTNSLIAGGTYNINCQLHNRGDISVPFPKVEFFLSDPTLGFNAQFATYLGVCQMEDILLANGNGMANFSYQVPKEESGHKCLIARTFSFSPLDKSDDLNLLDPTTDRHIGQKNLNIVTHETDYFFNLIHHSNTIEGIEFVPLTPNEMVALGAPPLKYRNFEERLNPQIFLKGGLTLVNENPQVKISPGKIGYEIISEGNGLTLEEQTDLKETISKGRIYKYSEKGGVIPFRDLITQKRKMNQMVIKTSLHIKIPNMGLKPGEAVAWNVINTNRTLKEVKGGITLVIIG